MKRIPTAYFTPALVLRFSLGLMCSGMALAQVTSSRAAQSTNFPTPYNTRQTDSHFLKPEDAVKTIQLPAGFKATLFAGEPDVQQPIGMTMDRRGRLWVAENYTYSEKPLSWDTNLSDRIVILEDTNHDGHFDKRTVFWDQAKKLTSVAVGFGGVFALCPPQLLFIPDRNGDDVPDGKPELLLDGFEDTIVWHNIANGLKLGPDGWLYGRQGIQGVSHVGAPGSSPEQRTALNAGVWRYHPVTHRFEVVAEGTTNPWGMDWDDNGQLFFINTVIGHFWHVIPGEYYKRMYGEHARQHLYELIDQTADHFHWDTREIWSKIREIGVSPTTSQAGGGHAHCGMMIYLGDNWPEQYRNTMFTVNFHGKRLNNDTIERQGASYTAHHGGDFLTVGDTWFRGIDLFYGPDGDVYLSDWSDIGECHDSDAIHRTSGRVYKITYGEPDHYWSGDMAAMTSKELVDLQLQHNDWFVRQARQLLQERAAHGDDMKEVHAQLHRMFETQKDVPRKLRALWALYVTQGTDEAWLRKLLHHDSEQARVWAIQLLVDQGAPSAGALSDFTAMAQHDPSGLVLSFLASAMRRAPMEPRWPLAMALAEHSEYADDRVLPLLIWYGIEPAVPENTGKAIELARSTRMPKLRRFVSRRIFEDLVTAPEAANQIVRVLKESKELSVQADILNGMSDALVGVKKPVAPSSWSEVGPVLSASANSVVAHLAQELGALFGDPKAISGLRSVVSNTKASNNDRRHALQTLVQIKADNLTPLLMPLLEDPEMAPDAIRALAATGEPQTPTILLERYVGMKPDAAKAEVINTLASRSIFATPLLESVHLGVVPRKDVSASQVRQLRSLKDPDIDARVNALWPQLDDSPSAKKQLFAHYKQLLVPSRLQAADLSAGRRVFQQTCAVCHTLYGEGAKIGPELTGADRHNLDYLLDNILDPSAVVPENYRAWVVSLKDDRVLNGIIVGQTDKLITLQTTSDKVVIQRSEIDSMNQSQLSMMPEGLLQGLSEQQACDLIAYLMSSAQVPLAGGAEVK
jgi:putative membrane-bound dehydrogenase-like protein